MRVESFFPRAIRAIDVEILPRTDHDKLGAFERLLCMSLAEMKKDPDILKKSDEAFARLKT